MKHKLEVVNDPAPMAPKLNTPPSLSSVIDYLAANRELLHREQNATAADAQKMIDTVEEARKLMNGQLDNLIAMIRGTMKERMTSVETVIGEPG